MPTYIPKLIAPDWIKEPSVIDPAYKKVIRNVFNLLGVGELDPPIGGIITNPIKKSINRHATKELTRLLRGKSERFPNTGVKSLSDEDATWLALHESRVPTKPPAPTELRISPYDKIIKPMSHRLRRDPDINEAFKQSQRSQGLSPNTHTNKQVSSHVKSLSEPAKHKDTKSILPSRHEYNAKQFMPMARELGSLHGNLGKVKQMTTREIDSLLLGPEKAFKAGIITRIEANDLLAKNKAKVDDYFRSIKSVDTNNYASKMNKLVNNPEPSNNLQPVLTAGKMHGATEEDLAKRYGISVEMVRQLLVRQ